MDAPNIIKFGLSSTLALKILHFKKINAFSSVKRFCSFVKKSISVLTKYCSWVSPILCSGSDGSSGQSNGPSKPVTAMENTVHTSLLEQTPQVAVQQPNQQSE